MIYMSNCQSIEERRVADEHELMLAGLAKERAHSRFRIWRGNYLQGMTLTPVQWSYDGAGGMLKRSGCDAQAFI
jgi:hypothetical protein